MVEAALPDRVVLVGFMAAGKTTVGPLLATRLGYRFVDIDAEVERLAGRSIAEIFETAGEEEFRRLEAAATAKLDEEGELVIAAGGGWMISDAVRNRWPDSVRVWLRATTSTILGRLDPRALDRPVLGERASERSIAALLAEREPSYELAELSVNTDDLDPGEIAELVASLLIATRE